MSYLLYGVKQGEGFIVITGDVGTGKTMLVGALSSMLERQNVAIANVVTTRPRPRTSCGSWRPSSGWTTTRSPRPSS